MSHRLRVFAGPNGSGKSSIYELIRQTKDPASGRMLSLGPFVNADQIEKTLTQKGLLSLDDFGVKNANPSIIDDYLAVSTLKSPYDPSIIKQLISLEGNSLKLISGNSSPFLSMIVADLLRLKLLELRKSFSIETVFSHQDKLAFLEKAIQNGYKVYLYFVSTESPEINLKRIEGRVAAGGHNVPSEKVIQRFERTMQNLLPTLKLAYRAYLFDNSGQETIKVAEKFTDGTIYLEERIPSWVIKYLGDGSE